MATLISSSNGLVVSSGLKFTILRKGDSQAFRTEKEKDEIFIQEIPEPLPRQDVQEVPQPAKENLRILCSAFSNNEKYVAFADDHKQLTLWEWQDNTGLKFIKQWNLVRRANKIIFDKNDQHILVADKSGDVFRFSQNDSEGQCILGHLSMLLDVKLSPCGKFIVTSDRDEKIRVSHYPNAYNIHNYCLGHTDFVSSLEMLNNQFLISGSGDSTLRLWDFLKGKEICQVHCSQDAGIEPLDIEDTSETDLRVKRTPYPAVLSIDILNNFISITMESLQGILLYNFNSDHMELKFLKKIMLNHWIWDVHFLSQDKLLLVQASEHNPILILDTVDEKQDSVMCDLTFFKDAMTTPDSSSVFVKELHKRWFDNVKEYLEKKRERTDQSSNGKKIKAS